MDVPSKGGTLVCTFLVDFGGKSDPKSTLSWVCLTEEGGMYPPPMGGGDPPQGGGLL